MKDVTVSNWYIGIVLLPVTDSYSYNTRQTFLGCVTKICMPLLFYCEIMNISMSLNIPAHAFGIFSLSWMKLSH